MKGRIHSAGGSSDGSKVIGFESRISMLKSPRATARAISTWPMRKWACHHRSKQTVKSPWMFADSSHPEGQSSVHLKYSTYSAHLRNTEPSTVLQLSGCLPRRPFFEQNCGRCSATSQNPPSPFFVYDHFLRLHASTARTDASCHGSNNLAMLFLQPCPLTPGDRAGAFRISLDVRLTAAAGIPAFIGRRSTPRPRCWRTMTTDP